MVRLLDARCRCSLCVVSCLHARTSNELVGRLDWSCRPIDLMTMSAPLAFGLVSICRRLLVRATMVCRVVLGSNALLLACG